MKWLTISLCVLFCIGVRADEKSPQYRVVCAGDSITEGHYPGILKNLLGKDSEVRVIAKGGASILWVQKMIHKMFRQGADPTHVVVYAGINDCLCWRYSSLTNGDCAQYIIESLKEIIPDIQAGGAIPVIVRHHMWDASRYDRTPLGNYCSIMVNEWLEEEHLALKPAVVVDTSVLGYKQNWPGCEEEGNCHRGNQLKDEYSGDGLHLNKLGSRVLARLIADAIR